MAEINGDNFTFLEQFEVHEIPCTYPPLLPLPLCGYVTCKKSSTISCTYNGTCTGKQKTEVFPEYYSAKIFELASRYQ
ncbi:MAG: hypothetical protein QXU31_06735 [Archaeoglobaceae archaeon]